MPETEPDTDVTYKTSLQTWRSVVKPELLFFSILPVSIGYAYGWYKTGYLPVQLSVIAALFLIVSNVLIFIAGDIVLVLKRANATKSASEDDRSSNRKEPGQVDTGKLLFLKAALTRGLAVAGILWGIIMWRVIVTGAINVTAGVGTGLYAVFYLLLVAGEKQRAGEPYLHEVVGLCLWSLTGVTLGSYLVTQYTFYPITVSYGIVLLLALASYGIIRYAVLSNRVYGEISLTQQAGDAAKKKTEEPEAPKLITLDLNGRFFMILPVAILLYYKIMTFISVSPYFVCAGLVSLVWSIDLVKQVVFMEYSEQEVPARMYRQSKFVYIGVCGAILLGLVLDMAFR